MRAPAIVCVALCGLAAAFAPVPQTSGRFHREPGVGDPRSSGNVQTAASGIDSDSRTGHRARIE